MFQVNPPQGKAEDSHEKSSLIFFEDKSKKLKCRLLQFLFGALRVKLRVKIYNWVDNKTVLKDMFNTII